MTGLVEIRGLAVEAIIGVRPWEREVRQTLVVDLGYRVNIARAAATDALADTIDYGAVARAVTRHIQNGAFQLIETAAQSTAQLLTDEFGAADVTVTLHKPGAIPNARSVSVTIQLAAAERSASEG